MGKIVVSITPSKYFVLGMVFLLYNGGAISKIISIPHFTLISLIIVGTIDLLLLPYVFSAVEIRKSLFLVVLLYFFPIVVSVISDSNSTKQAIIRFVSAVSIVIYTNYLISLYKQESLSIFFTLFEVLIYANLLSMLFYPNGMYRTVNTGVREYIIENSKDYIRTDTSRVHWLLGHQTLLMEYVLPALCIILLIEIKKESDIRTRVLAFTCIVEIIIANSASNYLILFSFVALVLIYYRFDALKDKLIYGLFLAIYVFYSTLIVLPALDRIMTILTVLMNRKVELASRIRVWSNAIYSIRKEPIIGHGVIDESSDAIWNTFGLANPHSEYLYFLYESGIIGLLLFTLFIISAGKKCSNVFQFKEAKISMAFIVTMLLAMITDDYLLRHHFILMMYVICFRIEDIIGMNDYVMSEDLA